MKKILLFIMALLSSNVFAAEAIDWNDKQLSWLTYEDGLKALSAKKGNGIFIIYADWCPTCKEYSHLFSDPKVVDALKGLTLIRANKDERPEISKQFSLDGEYVPRTFAMDANGKIIDDLNVRNPRWWYFIPPDNPDYLIEFAKAISAYQVSGK